MSARIVSATIDGADAVHRYLSEYHPDLMARLGVRALDAVETAERAIIARLPQGLVDPVGAEIRVGTDWVLVKLFVRGRPAKAFVEGYEGDVDVRAYLREMRSVFGRPVRPRVVSISEYVRRLDQAEHPLEVLAGEAVAQIVAALEDQAGMTAKVIP
jgi:hypothetical protein